MTYDNNNNDEKELQLVNTYEEGELQLVDKLFLQPRPNSPLLNIIRSAMAYQDAVHYSSGDQDYWDQSLQFWVTQFSTRTASNLVEGEVNAR